MAIFDVRNTKDNEVVKITFADGNSGYGCSIAKILTVMLHYLTTKKIGPQQLQLSKTQKI